MFLIENENVYECLSNEKRCTGNLYKVDGNIKKFDVELGEYIDNVDVMKYFVDGIENLAVENFDMYNVYIKEKIVYCTTKVIPKKIVYTKNEFYDIFTPAQFVAFMESIDVNVKYFKYRLNDFNEIKLDNSQTVAAIMYLKDNGYITLEQFNSII